MVVGMRKRTYEASEAAKREICLCALHSMSREHLKRFFQTDIHSM